MNWYYWKKIKLDIPRFWFNVSKIIIVGVILCGVSLFATSFIAIDNWLILFVCIIVYALIFCVLQWLLAMNSYEKELFIVPINKILVKLKIKKA